jgi:hypothetical protein
VICHFREELKESLEEIFHRLSVCGSNGQPIKKNILVMHLPFPQISNALHLLLLLFFGSVPFYGHLGSG